MSEIKTTLQKTDLSKPGAITKQIGYFVTEINETAPGADIAEILEDNKNPDYDLTNVDLLNVDLYTKGQTDTVKAVLNELKNDLP